MSHLLPKRAESPLKQQQQQQQQSSTISSKPGDQNSDIRPADTVPPRAALTRRTSSRGATTLRQGPPHRPAGAREPRELPDISQSIDSTKQTIPTSAPEQVILLKSEQEESKKKIRALEAELASERDLKEDLLANLERSRNQAEENRKLWKQTARELRKATQTQGVYQVTDSQLISSIQQLKYSIRNFAIQYFTGVTNGARFQREQFDAWVSPTTLGTRAYVEYFRSPSRCSSIIQAMLWRLLVKRIFDQFLWAGRAGDSFCGLRFYLKLASRSEPNPDVEIERKFQMWSADTTALMLQMGDFEEGTEDYHIFHNNLKSIRNDFWDMTSQFLVTRGQGPARELRRIVDDAIALDKQIHRQAARIKWELLDEGPAPFNPEQMETEQGQERPSPGKQVLLAVAPGVKKQGKSDGQDFEREQLLVPIEVSCQPPTDLPSVVSETSYKIFGMKF
ncbi:hypothetical protein BJX64DRAFT_283836 [Aspergillus heterothallicus]